MFLSIIEHSKSGSGGTAPPVQQTFNYSFNEDNGDLIDSVGGVNGTCEKTMYGALGIEDKAQGFHSDSYIRIPHNDGLSIENKFSIDGFVLFTDLANATMETAKAFVLFNKRDSNTGRREWQLIYYQQAFQFIVFDANDIERTYSVPYTLTANQWLYIAVSVNTTASKSIKLWINKVEGGQADTGTFTPKNKIIDLPLFIGQAGWVIGSVNLSHYGLLDSWRIQKGIELTQADVDTRHDSFFTNQTEATVKMTDLKVSFGLGEASGNAIDSVNGLSGVVSGTVTRAVAGVGGGNAIQFTDGKITVPHNELFNLYDGVKNLNFAFHLNMFITKSTVTDMWVLNKRDSSNTAYQLVFFQNALRLYIYNSDGTEYLAAISNSFTPRNTWLSIGGFSDVSNSDPAKTFYFVINNKIVKPSITGTIKTFKNTTTDLAIGKAAWTNFAPVVGTIDELRLWTGTEIQTGIFSREFNYGNGITL